MPGVPGGSYLSAGLAACLLACGPAFADVPPEPPPTSGLPADGPPDAGVHRDGDPTFVDPRDESPISALDDPCIPAAPPGAENDPEWLDRMEMSLRLGGCRSAQWIDGLFGQTQDSARYREVHGNIAPSMLWTQYDGFKARMRFRIDLPLPQMDGQWRAFIGRVDREEFVTERAEPSGALPRQFGAIGDEQTLLGLGFGGGRGREGFDASAGIRVSTPLDPYLKASYRMAWTPGPRSTVRLRPTVFWQQSEQFGVTTRVDFDRDLAEDWFTRLTASATYSGRSLGTRGYANATVFHRLSERRAMAFQVGVDGETEADVPLREYGVRTTYRQNVLRDYLVLELRASLTWPRERLDESRPPSWGAGVGFEMVFGPGSFRGGD